jgi:hypothetical protein
MKDIRVNPDGEHRSRYGRARGAPQTPKAKAQRQRFKRETWAQGPGFGAMRGDDIRDALEYIRRLKR